MSAFDQLAAKLAALKGLPLPHNDPGFGQPFIGPHPGQPGYVAPVAAHGIPHYNPGAPGDSGFGGFGQGGQPMPHPQPQQHQPNILGIIQQGHPNWFPLTSHPIARPQPTGPRIPKLVGPGDALPMPSPNGLRPAPRGPVLRPPMGRM